MADNKECTGLKGKLFGHKYKTVYSTKNNPPSVEEAQRMIGLISTNLTPMVIMSSGAISWSSQIQRQNEINTYNNRVQRIIEGRGKETYTPLYEVCTRCDDKISIE